MKVANPTPTQIRDSVTCPRRAYLGQYRPKTPASLELIEFLIFHDLNKEEVVPFILRNYFIGQEASLEEIIKVVAATDVEERISYLEPDIRNAERWASVYNFLIAMLEDKDFGHEAAQRIQDIGYVSKKYDEDKELKQTNKLVDEILDLNSGRIRMEYSQLIDEHFRIDREGLADNFIRNHTEVVAPAVYRILSKSQEEKNSWWLTEDKDYKSMSGKLDRYQIYGRPDFIVFVEEKDGWQAFPLEVKNKVRKAERAQNIANKIIVDSHLGSLAEKAEIPKDKIMPANYMMFFTYEDWAGGEKHADLFENRLPENYGNLLFPSLQMFKNWEKNPVENKPNFSKFYDESSRKCQNCYKRIPCLVEYKLSVKQ